MLTFLDINVNCLLLNSLKQETCIQATSSKVMQPLESAVVECYIINIVYQNWNNELVTPLCQTDSLQNFLLKAQINVD